MGTESPSFKIVHVYRSFQQKPEKMPKNSPVLVYIHGGAFEHGSGDISEIKPDAIVKQNLIFVTINYRLNIFGIWMRNEIWDEILSQVKLILQINCWTGFLNLGTEECCANAGLKDQVAALRWIKANIDRFSGDPSNVTITGHSAGATCVNLHMISPLSKGEKEEVKQGFITRYSCKYWWYNLSGLFHKAIVQAGGIYCPWGYLGKQHRLRKLFSEAYNIKNELRHVLVQTLKNEDATELMKVASQILDDEIRVSTECFTITVIYKCHEF